MFTEVTFGEFLERFFHQARERYGIEFADRYPNLAVYTTEATGIWAHEIFDGFCVRFWRWLRRDLPEVVISGPYSNERETPDEFAKRFEREFWAAIEKLRE